MRRPILAVLLSACASVALADPTPKEQLLKPPADARHFTISSTAGKHGDIWSWKTADGKLAYRMSMSLRGWVTEDDELITLGAEPESMTVFQWATPFESTLKFSVASP